MFGRLSSLLSLPGPEKGAPRAPLGEGRLPRLSSQSRGSGAGGWALSGLMACSSLLGSLLPSPDPVRKNRKSHQLPQFVVRVRECHIGSSHMPACEQKALGKGQVIFQNYFKMI